MLRRDAIRFLSRNVFLPLAGSGSRGTPARETAVNLRSSYHPHFYQSCKHKRRRAVPYGPCATLSRSPCRPIPPPSEHYTGQIVYVIQSLCTLKLEDAPLPCRAHIGSLREKAPNNQIAVLVPPAQFLPVCLLGLVVRHRFALGFVPREAS